MRRAALILAVAAAGLACVKDHPCRDNTVLINFEFADSRDLVDGVALKYRLDDAPAVGLKPIERPPGVDRGGLELAVQDYASHKKLTLQYAPRKAGNVVGSWQEAAVEIKPGCTTIDLIVAMAGGGDAGLGDAPAVDASLAIEAPADEKVVEAGVDGVLRRDAAPEVLAAMPEAGPVDAPAQPDVPVAPEGDAPQESAAPVDLPAVVVVVDAFLAQDAPSGAASDATPEGSPEVSTGPGPDVAPDGPTDAGQVGCVIDSTPYASGAANPANVCQTCQPALSGSTWTNVSSGTPCGSGQVCSVGICRLGCWLDGSFYPAAATKPSNACQYCNPTLSTGAWTSENDGTSCGSGQVCNAGLCGTGCWVSGTFYTSGAANPANACQTCQPGISDTAWSNSANGASCDAGQVCISTICQGGCWIDSTLYSSGTAKPGSPCQTCQPGASVTAWTNSASTTACPTGQVCTAGACQPGCSIGGTYYAKDAANPSNACQVCKPGTAVALWTNLADGTGCGTGKVCSAASCQAGCWIDVAFRATGVTKSDNACQSCQPGVSGTAWTNVGDGTSCGNQQGCSAGVCGSGCWISSVFYTSGTAKSDNPCQSCQPGTSTTAWTNVADSTGCGSGQVCYLGTCGDCVPGTPRCKDASTRQICQANRTWLDDTPACTFGCNSNTSSCYPDCTPDALGCSTNAEPKQCDASGTWQVVGAACTYGCNSGSGTCYPQCTPNALGCSTSTQPRQCDASGMWQNLTACIAGKEECVGAGNCLKVDGRACAVPGQCASGVCTTFYVDADGDGYTINPASFCGTSPPSGYVSSSLGTDCCDSDANAHPGQTAYFTTTRIGCGGYDYNCAGGDEPQYTATFNVNFTSLIVCGAGPAGGAWSAVTVPPACGASGSWMLLTDCFCMAGMSGPQRCPYSGCNTTCYQGCAGFTCGSSRTQACR